MPTRRQVLAGGLALAGAGLMGGRGWLGGLVEPAEAATIPSAPLHETAAARGLFYGAATDFEVLYDQQFATAFWDEVGMLVPENELKWTYTEPAPNVFTFEAADLLVEAAELNGKLLRGVPLVWDQGYPEWFNYYVNGSNASQILQNHIQTVIGHYRGKFHSWDVVSEAMAPNGYAPCPWIDLIGTSYIENSFVWAKEADPEALLCYNDYGVESLATSFREKADQVLWLLTKLVKEGIPIDVFSCEGHMDAVFIETDYTEQHFYDYLRRIEDLGLKIIISELDMSDQHLPYDIPYRDMMVAKGYTRYLTPALAVEAVLGVVTWGLSDRYTWLDEHDPRPDHMPQRPLPLGFSMAREDAWSACSAAFAQATPR